MLMTGFISWIATPIDQTKSNPLANQEESSITKFWLVSTLSQCHQEEFSL